MDEIEPQADVDVVLLTYKLLFMYTMFSWSGGDGYEDGCEGRVESIIRPSNL